MSQSKTLLTALIPLLTIPSLALPAQASVGGKCEYVFTTDAKAASKAEARPKVTLDQLLRDPKEGWGLAVEAVEQLRLRFEGSDYVLHSLLTAILSREFAWLNGDPGGAKTLISRTLFAAELKSLTEPMKKTFVLQFHKLLNEGVITGFPQLKKMLDEGVFARNIDNSLISDKFIFLIADEVEKAHPALQTTLLSVLNERKAFLGSEVVETLLTSGVFTSNKTIGELVDAAGEDRAAIEALVDRMAIKTHVINQTLDSLASVRMRRKIEWSKENPFTGMSGALHLSSRVKEVKIPRELLEEMAQIIRRVDAFYMTKYSEAEKSRGTLDVKTFFPPNQFSNRSIVKLMQTWKAAFLARQLMEGKSFEQIRWKMEAGDLRDLATGALLNAPGGFRHKSVKLELEVLDGVTGIPLHTDKEAAYEPQINRLSFKTEDGTPLAIVFDLAKGKVVTSDRYLDSDGQIRDAASVIDLQAVLPQLKKLDADHSQLKGLEDDGVLNQYLAMKTLPKRTRTELDLVQESRTVFLNLMNAAVEKLEGKQLDYNLKDEASTLARLELEKKGRELDQKIAAIRSGKVTVSESNYYLWAATTIRQAYKELTTDFRELDYSVRAHLVSILARTHLLAYGPPGGAKTALARTVLVAALKSVNQSALAPQMKEFHHDVLRKYAEVLNDLKRQGKLTNTEYKEYELFFRQFHKMVPEGDIVGYAKLNEQLETGNLAYDRTQSMSHERFLFAILDEVEKGNPALLQTLLSILNEREVFAGHEVVKTMLATAVLTSNKVPFEFLESFGDDRPAGLALMDRTINKVFVLNKFAEDRTLVTMLKDIESGSFNPRLTSPLMLVEMQPILKQIKIPPRVELFLLETIKQWQGRRLEMEQRTMDAFTSDSLDNPNYYVPATKPSNRSENANMDQLKATWLLQSVLDGRFDRLVQAQADKGIPLSQMKFDMDFEDVALIAQGLLFWGPYEYKSKRNEQGVLQFELHDERLAALINSSGTSDRLRYQLEMIQDEAKDLLEIMNTELSTTIQKHRELIGKYSPTLFPGLLQPAEGR